MKGLCDNLVMKSQCKGRSQQISCYKGGDETRRMGSHEHLKCEFIFSALIGGERGREGCHGCSFYS